MPTVHTFADTVVKLKVDRVSAYYGKNKAIKDVSFQVPTHAATAMIGPSGCGKSTLIRCLNRMHEVTPEAHAEGHVLLDGEDIYGLDASDVRYRIGMVFQKPNPFPTMSIYKNVCAGLRLNGQRNRDVLDAAVIRALKQAALWDEVKEQIHRPGPTFPAGSSSASASPARWRSSPRSC